MFPCWCWWRRRSHRRRCFSLPRLLAAPCRVTTAAVTAAGGDAEQGVKKEDGSSVDAETLEEGAPAAVKHTPAFLENMRKSRVWTAVAYSSNQHIHDEVETNAEVRGCSSVQSSRSSHSACQ